MALQSGAVVTLDVEKPAVGGRMVARHEGEVVLVAGAIPGERVTARVERAGRSLAFAETVSVVSPSADRREDHPDPRCGGNVFAHVSYGRQLRLKAEIVDDAFRRIARLPLAAPVEVAGSPERGYRMRARLHVREGRAGFYREGTHDLCDAAGTGQLSAATAGWIAAAQEALARARIRDVTSIEIAENVEGTERASHLELHAGSDVDRLAALADGLVGLSARRADSAQDRVIAGTPVVTDKLRVGAGDASREIRLRRHARAFFQGNRFLIESLVQRVVGLAGTGPIVDLYAGVGLFGLGCAATGAPTVTLVEGDPVSAADLRVNAEPYRERVRLYTRSVESALASPALGTPDATFIVDPPRTGLSRDATAGILDQRPKRLVYVSCDVATLARDARNLVNGGYAVESVGGIDLFPNTAHVETLALLVRTT